MKRILLFLSMLLCLTAGYAQNINSGDPCEGPGGNCNQQPARVPTRYPGATGSIPVLQSLDPNEVIGPEGYDSVKWVSINDVLKYTILFENDPEFATAAAQMIDVRFDFQSKAWMKSFGIGNYSFSNLSFNVDKPSNAYQNRIDLKDSLGYFVDLIAGLDVTKQQGFWTFTTIDPETGYAPWRAELGLLPVNDSTHVGEGAVTFQLKPYEGLKTGDTISIQANIVFDQNDTIATNRWCNRIDAGMPESKVKATPHLSSQEGEGVAAYNLTFTAQDDEGGSGIRHILLYLANHSGIYEEIDTCMVDSVLTFPVETGKQYKIYSIAVDNTGNREPAKMGPDIILNFNVAPTDIVLSDTVFQDDILAGGFIAELSSEDGEAEGMFTYALAEGDGAIHNDLFQINGTQLQAKDNFKSAEDSIYKVRISTTDEGGLSYSKVFTLSMKYVLERPKPDTLAVTICEGDFYDFHGSEYDQTGIYRYTVSNDYMRDSIYVLQLTVIPRLEAPIVTVEGSHTLVSSAAKGNQWFYEDGTWVEGATEQKFTPTEDGVYYVAASNGYCFSDPSQKYRVKLSDNTVLDMQLEEGWNWISTNLSDDNWNNAKAFVAPIENKVERLVGVTSELVNDPVYGLTGALKELTPQSLYKLQMNESAEQTWDGTAYSTEDIEVSLQKGWNWLGYVPTHELPLAEALTQLTATENDVIKGFDSFATFENGQWTGTLEMMRPGEGYMYYAGSSMTFNYPTRRAFPVEESLLNARSGIEKQVLPWNYRKNDFPDNMTLIASVYANDVQTLEGTYTIGAFVGNECRGIGKYVKGKLFMMIHGTVSENSSVTFKAYENISGKEFDIRESLTFDGQHVGTMNNSYALHIDGTTGVDEAMTNAYIIYPNPLRSRMFIQGETERITKVQLLSSSGEIVLSVAAYTEDGIDVATLVPGVYVAAITTDKGVQYKKVVKAN